MNRDLFSKFTTSPSNIGAQDIPTLEAFAEQFPYCQLAHFFVAKPHYDLMTVHAEGKVQRAAVFATSRYKLKRFLEIQAEKVTSGESGFETGFSGHTDTVSSLNAHIEAQAQLSPIDELLDRVDLSALPLTQQEKITDQSAVLTQSLGIPDSDIDSFNEKIKKLKQNEIIENFIKTEPRITSLAHVSKEAPAKDMSERSIKAPSGLVSENLANIMLKQGKTDKAIEIYEKLMLKYPEKKSYFAEKIENLKSI